MKAKKWCCRLLLMLSTVFLIIGVPILINELYKANTIIYITKWNAEDVLGYYGTILGSFIAVITLVATIAFTKKQIQRESFLNWENDKWNRLDTVFMRIIDSINPMEVLKCVMDTGFTDPDKAINHLQKYQMNCKIASDQLNANLNTDDYPKFKSLIDSVFTVSEEFIRISQRLVDLYSDFRFLNHRDTALQTLETEEKYPGSFSQEVLDFNKDVLKKIEKITFPDIEIQVAEANNNFIKTYEMEYRSLLQLKGSTFEVVRRDTRQHADDILNWRRK